MYSAGELFDVFLVLMMALVIVLFALFVIGLLIFTPFAAIGLGINFIGWMTSLGFNFC